jgi:hypothetical protein
LLSLRNDPPSSEAAEAAPPLKDAPVLVASSEPAKALIIAPERKDVSFVGLWGAGASACSARNQRGLILTVIDNEGARAGDTFCRFKRKRAVPGGWDVVASCASARERWTTNVKLRLEGERLVWTSRRGAQSYVRCSPGVMFAQAASRN